MIVTTHSNFREPAKNWLPMNFRKRSEIPASCSTKHITFKPVMIRGINLARSSKGLLMEKWSQHGFCLRRHFSSGVTSSRSLKTDNWTDSSGIQYHLKIIGLPFSISRAIATTSWRTWGRSGNHLRPYWPPVRKRRFCTAPQKDIACC